MGFWDLFFKKEQADSVRVSKPYIWGQFDPRTAKWIHDKQYLLLPEKRLKKLLWTYYDHEALSYHSNSDEFPDCDDFALLAMASAIKGAAQEGFDRAPAFGLISYKYKNGEGYHRANFGLFKEGFMEIFEPQTGEWSRDFSRIERFTTVEL